MYYQPEVLKGLVRKGAILSGIIVKIDSVGYALWSNVDFNKLVELSKKYQEIDLPQPFDRKYPFAPMFTVVSQPANFVMDIIHFLNEEDDLPGLASFKEFRLMEAA